MMAVKDISDLTVCEAYRTYQVQVNHDAHTTSSPNELLQVFIGQPAKVCFRAQERAFKRGLVDYGVSLNTGWLTEKGEELLTEADNN